MTRADSDPIARACERHIERLEVQIARALDGSVTVATLLDLRRDPHCLIDPGLMTRARELHRQLLEKKVTTFSDRDGTVQPLVALAERIHAAAADLARMEVLAA